MSILIHRIQFSYTTNLYEDILAICSYKLYLRNFSYTYIQELEFFMNEDLREFVTRKVS